MHADGMTAATVSTVNVLREITVGAYGDTAIDKRPVDGPVQVSAAGLHGDVQLNAGHGGADRAVYAYAEEDATWWARELGRDIPPGLFGENLRTRGLEVTGAVIGELWRIGEVLLEVRMPRSPCENLSHRMGLDGFHREFRASGRVGAMLRVREVGSIRPGSAVVVEHHPDHGVTIADLAVRLSAADGRRLLHSGASLAPRVRARARRIVARTPAASVQ